MTQISFGRLVLAPSSQPRLDCARCACRNAATWPDAWTPVSVLSRADDSRRPRSATLGQTPPRDCCWTPITSCAGVASRCTTVPVVLNAERDTNAGAPRCIGVLSLRSVGSPAVAAPVDFCPNRRPHRELPRESLRAPAGSPMSTYARARSSLGANLGHRASLVEIVAHVLRVRTLSLACSQASPGVVAQPWHRRAAVPRYLPRRSRPTPPFKSSRSRSTSVAAIV